MVRTAALLVRCFLGHISVMISMAKETSPSLARTSRAAETCSGGAGARLGKSPTVLRDLFMGRRPASGGGPRKIACSGPGITAAPSTVLCAIGDAQGRLVADREADRAGDEAQRAGLVMQGLGLARHRRVGDRHRRAEYHLGELATAARRVHRHRANRGVGVVGDDHSSGRAQVEVPQHVALGERSDQQFLRVPAGRVAAEGGVGRAEDGRLAVAVNFVVAAVASVVAGPRAGVSGPPDSHFVAVRGSHYSSVLRQPFSELDHGPAACLWRRARWWYQRARAWWRRRHQDQRRWWRASWKTRVSRQNRRLTSATVSGIRPGPAGGWSCGLAGGGRAVVRSRALAAVTAHTARAAMDSTRCRQIAV